MGDAVAESESGPPSEVTYRANIATVHVKTEDDDKDLKHVSPATRRKQKNGILKKTTPTTTPTTTTSTPTTRTPAGTTLTVAAPSPGGTDDVSRATSSPGDADDNDTVNNNNKESPYQGLVTVTEPSDTTLPNGGVADDSDTGDTDGGHKKVSWSAETVVYTSRVDGGQRVANRQTNGRPAAPLDDGQWDRRHRPSPLDQAGRSDKTTQKCCVIIAVKLLIIAVVGLVVLGIMYALR